MQRERAAARDRLISAAGFQGAHIVPLAADASFRSYDRVLHPNGRRAVLMNAPPDKEDVQPFHQIADLLLSWSLSPPRILGADAEAGFLLLEDLGDDLFSRLIGQGHDEAELYGAAIDVLADISRRSPPVALPAYDMDLLVSETDLVLDWRFPEVRGRDASSAERQSHREAWRTVLAHVADNHQTLVLRDYHVDNLIWLPDRPGLRAVGLLDFQDAVRGHAAYDLASLLSDVRRDVSPELEADMLTRYLAQTEGDADTLRRAYRVLAAQRNAKILGIFTRLWRRDGKDAYLKWLPRTWQLLRRDLADPSLAPVARWYAACLSDDPAAAA